MGKNAFTAALGFGQAVIAPRSGQANQAPTPKG